MSDFDFWSDANLHGNKLKDVVIGTKTDVKTPTAGALASEDGVLWIYTGTKWNPLGSSEDVSALEDRVDAIEDYESAYKSGIDSDKVAQIATNTANITANATNIETNTTAISGLTSRLGTAESSISSLQSGKVNVLSTGPTGSSGTKVSIDNQGLVTSVTSASMSDISDWATEKATLQDKLTFDTTPTAGSSNPVTSGGVQAAIASAVSSAYKVKGTKTCAQINQLSGMIVGDVYNVSDSGTIGTSPNQISVNAGDNVVWSDENKWDRLAGTMDLSGYVQVGVTINSVALPATGGITLTPANVGALAVDGTAVKATADASGNNIESTYETKTTVAGKMNKLGTTPSAGMIITSTAADNVVQASSTSLSDITTAIADDTTEGSIKKYVKDGYVAKDGNKGLSTEDFTSEEKTKLAGIAAEAQVNVIESVKVNGTAQTVTDKAVDITVPTKTSDLLNDGKVYGAFISSTEATALINSAIANYFTKSQTAALFDEATFTLVEKTATVNVANVWMAQVMDATTNEVVYAEVIIGANSVTINANSAPEGGLKLRYVVKPVAPSA